SVSAAISTSVVRLLGEYTGRVPIQARTYMNEDLIIVALRDKLTTQERAIAHGGGGDLVRSARQALQKAMEPELTMAVERLSGRSVIACLSHDHLDPDIVVESFVLAPRTNGAHVETH